MIIDKTKKYRYFNNMPATILTTERQGYQFPVISMEDGTGELHFHNAQGYVKGDAPQWNLFEYDSRQPELLTVGDKLVTRDGKYDAEIIYTNGVNGMNNPVLALVTVDGNTRCRWYSVHGRSGRDSTSNWDLLWPDPKQFGGLTDAQIRANELASGGYRRVSNNNRIVSRIDRYDWKEYMASECSPHDMRWVKAMGELSAADHYRRCFSKDTMKLDQEVYKLIPGSGDMI